MIKLAYHTFASLTPGEMCTGEDCTGVRSFVQLMSMTPYLKVGDDGVSHRGKLNQDELYELLKAREEYLARCNRVF